MSDALAQTGAPPRFERIALEDGLSQNNVTSIVQDRRGFLWFGTLDGLNRYDGYTFLTYRNLPGDSTTLTSNTISALLEDDQHRLWIGTMAEGLNVLDLRTNRIDTFVHGPGNPTSLPSNRIRTLCLGPDGRIWIGSRGGGLTVFDPDSQRFTRVPLPKTEASQEGKAHIRSLLFDRSGHLWVGTAARGLLVLGTKADSSDPNSILSIVHIPFEPDSPEGVSHPQIESLAEDGTGRIWAGTYGGGIDVFRIDSAAAVSESGFHVTKTARYAHNPRDPRSVGDNAIEAIFRDHEGVMWIGTAGAGLSRFDSKTGSFSNYRHVPENPSSLSFNNIDVIFEDASHNLWVGTWGGGLSKLDRKPEKFHHLKHLVNRHNSLSHNYVRAIAEDPGGNVWVGSTGGGLDRIDAESGAIDHFTHLPSNAATLSHNDVRSILFDRQGNLWVGTYGGGVDLAPAYQLRQLQRGGVVAPRFTHFSHDPRDSTSLSSNYVWCLVRDRDGNIWIGTNAGLNLFDPVTRSFRTFRHDPARPGSISHDIVRTIYQDAAGDLWIGTYSGLNRYIAGEARFERYPHEPNNLNSLSHNSVTAICADSAGILWVGTLGGGLNRLDPEKREFRHYRLEDGLPNMFVHALLFDQHGRLWISTNRGLSVFLDRRPAGEQFRNYDASDGLQSNEFNAGAALKSRDGTLYFGGINGLNYFQPDELQDNPFVPPVVLTDFRVFNRTRRFDRALSEITEITLSHKDDFFAFEFAALDFTAPLKNKYAYKLEGFDGEWIEAGSRRYAAYTNLGPGSYTFRVRASNNDGVWNQDGLAVKIEVRPPFWQRWWFRIFVLLAGGGIVFSVFSYRTRQLRLEKEAQENFSRRLVEAQEQERQRLAGELHDSLGQELIILNNMLQQNALEFKDSPRYVQAFDTLSQMVVEAINEVRKLSSELHPHLLERLGIAKAVEAMAGKIADSSGLTFSLDLEEVDRLLPAPAKLNVYRALQELLNNIIKHAQASRVTITTSLADDRLIISVQDDGIGFDPARLQGSKGLGLASIRQRIRTLRGQMRIHSQPGHGTRVELVLRLDENPIKATS